VWCFSEDGCSTVLWNAGNQPPHYMALQPRKSQFPSSLQWKPQILHNIVTFLTDNTKFTKAFQWLSWEQFTNKEYKYICYSGQELCQFCKRSHNSETGLSD